MENLTVVTYACGSIAYFRTCADGKKVLHREDGPAEICHNGDEIWRFNGAIHRIGGPAITREDGSFEWRQHGLLHREDGPAMRVPDGTLIWAINDQSHRLDGPSCVAPDGSGLNWTINGEDLSREEFARRSPYMRDLALILTRGCVRDESPIACIDAATIARICRNVVLC